MDAKLSVEVGAKIDDLTSKMVQAEKSVAGFADKSGKKIDQFAKSGGQSLQNFAKGSNAAGFALNNLSRVAQDAPFGFIGIQNNLNPLLESFQQLQKETGSTGKALKALGSSLIGPAGLGLALSLVTAGLVFYTQWQQKSSKATEDGAKANEDYVKSLDQVTQARLKGAQNAADELTTLNLVYKATQNTSLSLKDRIKASDDLQKKYPKYFKGLTDEAILAGQASGKYKELSESILASARAAAARDLISQNTSRTLLNEQQISDERVKNQKILNQLEKVNSELKIQPDNLYNVLKARDLEKQREESDKRIYNLITDNNKLRDRSLHLEKQINTEIQKGADLIGGIGDGFEKGERIKQIDFADGIGWSDLIKRIQENQKKGFEKLEEDTRNTTITLDPKIDIDPMADAFLAIQKKWDEFNGQIGQIVNSGINDAFAGFGEGLGSALAEGTNILESVGGNLLSSLGDILIQLGKLAIKTGIGIQAIKTALKSLNPFVAIAAGTALVAFGSFIKGQVANLGGGNSDTPNQRPRRIPGFASGVTNFRGGVALVGERGPEIVTLPTNSSVIPNHRSSSIFNGGFNLSVDDVVVRGQDIYISWMRTAKLNKRTG